MNYIELINQFWRLNEEHSFTTSEVAVYFYLLNTANRLSWKNPFNQSNGYIINALNISEPTLIRVRNNLKNYGLLDFKSDKGRKNLTLYTLQYLNSFSNNVSNKPGDSNKTLNDVSIPVSNTVSNVVSNPVSIPVENSLDNNKLKLNETKPDDDGESAIAIELEKMKKKVAAQEKIIQGLGKNKKPDQPPPSPPPPPSGSQAFKPVEELLAECMSDIHFSDPIRMKNKMSDEVLSGWLMAFNRELLFNGVSRKLPRDYRSHFARWLKFQDLRTDPANYSPVKEQNNETGATGAGKGTSAERAAAGRDKYAQRVREQFPGVEQ